MIARNGEDRPPRMRRIRATERHTLSNCRGNLHRVTPPVFIREDRLPGDERKGDARQAGSRVIWKQPHEAPTPFGRR